MKRKRSDIHTYVCLLSLSVAQAFLCLSYLRSSVSFVLFIVFGDCVLRSCQLVWENPFDSRALFPRNERNSVQPLLSPVNVQLRAGSFDMRCKLFTVSRGNTSLAQIFEEVYVHKIDQKRPNARLRGWCAFPIKAFA